MEILTVLRHSICTTQVLCGKLQYEPSHGFLLNTLLLTLCCCAFCIVVICCATTDSTSTSMRLNSSKHAQAPELQEGRQTEHDCD